MGKLLCVLLAEDDVSVRNLMILRLQHLGHSVRAAEDGRQALDLALGEDHFDLVLMDVQMPEMDGLEAIRHLRANPATRALPILVVSATGTADGMQAGADHFLGKPHTKAQLQAAIAHTFEMRAIHDGEA